MSFVDHLLQCNAHDLSRFFPFVVDGERVGHVRHDNADLLRGFPDVFVVGEDFVTLAPGLEGYDSRTKAVDEVLRSLAEDGVIGNWRDEPYPVGMRWNGPHKFQIERSAAPFFGTRAWGVHVNGFTIGDDGPEMWIGIRADDRPVCPGQLDNMVAGGQPVGIGLLENVIKEAGEEASVPEPLARQAVPVGSISYVMEDGVGLKPDTMFCWDIELPREFVPKNTDGEIAEFLLLPVAEVMAIVDRGFEFKFNCNLVNIDFFVRHGFLSPEHPDYERIVGGLRQQIPESSLSEPV